MKRAGLTLLHGGGERARGSPGKPDFSGSWTLDKEKSTMPQMGGGPGGPGGPGGGVAEALTIKQTATEPSARRAARGR